MTAGLIIKKLSYLQKTPKVLNTYALHSKQLLLTQQKISNKFKNSKPAGYNGQFAGNQQIP